MSHEAGGSRIPRVLMLCYYYPPIATSGTQRSVRFAKKLRSYGWHPIVLTVKRSRNPWEGSGERIPDDVQTERSPEWNLLGLILLVTGVLNRIFDSLRVPRRSSLLYNFFVPDPQIAWFSTWSGARLARSCDCVYVSCSPFSSALSGCIIKWMTGKPLILDFRDAWSLNPHSKDGPLRSRLVSWLERLVVRTCDALILNTAGAERAYRTRYPEYAQKFTWIPNGFDHIGGPVASTSTAGRFTIMHVGDFYRSRTPDRLLEALSTIADPRIEFVQVGPPFASVDRYKGKVSIRIIDRVPHAEALKLMRSAALLYVAQGFEAGVSHHIAVAAKTYEYLATGLPILADCPPGDNADLVRRYASRSYVITTREARDIELSVRDALHRQPATAAPRADYLDTFNSSALTAQLAQVLAGVTGLRAGVPSLPVYDVGETGRAPSDAGPAR